MKCKARKKTRRNSQKPNADTVAYRLKCAKTANGLSHFVMYGDVPKDQAPM